MSDKPRQYTVEEIQKMVIEHLWHMIDYCENETRRPTSKEKLELFMHSTLAMFDGSCGGIPAFKICPEPHPEDKAYHKEHGENWFPSGPKYDIGPLHEVMYVYKPKEKEIK